MPQNILNTRSVTNKYYSSQQMDDLGQLWQEKGDLEKEARYFFAESDIDLIARSNLRDLKYYSSKSSKKTDVSESFDEPDKEVLETIKKMVGENLITDKIQNIPRDKPAKFMFVRNLGGGHWVGVGVIVKNGKATVSYSDSLYFGKDYTYKSLSKIATSNIKSKKQQKALMAKNIIDEVASKFERELGRENVTKEFYSHTWQQTNWRGEVERGPNSCGPYTIENMRRFLADSEEANKEVNHGSLAIRKSQLEDMKGNAPVTEISLDNSLLEKVSQVYEKQNLGFIFNESNVQTMLKDSKWQEVIKGELGDRASRESIINQLNTRYLGQAKKLNHTKEQLISNLGQLRASMGVGRFNAFVASNLDGHVDRRDENLVNNIKAGMEILTPSQCDKIFRNNFGIEVSFGKKERENLKNINKTQEINSPSSLSQTQQRTFQSQLQGKEEPLTLDKKKLQLVIGLYELQDRMGPEQFNKFVQKGLVGVVDKSDRMLVDDIKASMEFFTLSERDEIIKTAFPKIDPPFQRIERDRVLSEKSSLNTSQTRLPDRPNKLENILEIRKTQLKSILDKRSKMFLEKYYSSSHDRGAVQQWLGERNKVIMNLVQSIALDQINPVLAYDTIINNVGKSGLIFNSKLYKDEKDISKSVQKLSQPLKAVVGKEAKKDLRNMGMSSLGISPKELELARKEQEVIDRQKQQEIKVQEKIVLNNNVPNSSIMRQVIEEFAQKNNKDVIKLSSGQCGKSDAEKLNKAVQNHINNKIKENKLRPITSHPTNKKNVFQCVYKGKKILTQTIDEQGNFTFTPEKNFNGIIMVARKDSKGLPIKGQMDIIEYKNGEPIAVSLAIGGTCKIANIENIKKQVDSRTNFVNKLSTQNQELQRNNSYIRPTIQRENNQNRQNSSRRF